MKYLGILIIFVFVSSFRVGVDPYAELDEIMAVWETDNLLECEMQISYFKPIEAKKPNHFMIIDFKQKKSDSYFRADTYEAVSVGKSNMLFDIEAKQMKLFPFSEATAVKPMQSVKAFIALTKKEEGFKVGWEKINKNFSKILISAPGISATKMELIYNSKNHFLQSSDLKIWVEDDPYQPRNNERILTEFHNFKVTERAFPFRKKDFVKERNGRFFPVKARHRGFQVIDLTKEEK